MGGEPLRDWLTHPLVETELRRRSVTDAIMQHVAKVRAAAKWYPFVPEHMTAARAVVDERGGQRVTRRELMRFAATALSSDRDDDYVRLYMICQLWGIGGGGRMHHTRTTLNTPDIAHRFRQLAQAVMSDQPSCAEGRWAPGWNTAFTTKYAYAVALAVNPDAPPALILDDRVRRTLNTLGWPWPESGDGYKDRRRYAGYLRELTSLGADLQVRPDAIEWLLFAPSISLLEVMERP